MAFKHKTPIDFEREYILGPDGVFYSREVVTTPITDQHTLVDRCKFKEELLVQNNLNRFLVKDPDESKSVQVTYTRGYFEGFYKQVPSIKQVFVPITCFPFPKAKLRIDPEADPEDEFKYNLSPYNPTAVNTQNTVNPAITPSYCNNNYKLFLYFAVSQGELNPSKNYFSVRDPYLFAVNIETNEPVVVNLPNVFDTGRLCTGTDYGKIDGETNIRDVVNVLLKELFTSPANSDLMPSDSQRRTHLTYSELGVLKQPTKEQSKVSASGFFSPCTRGQIVDFCGTEACQNFVQNQSYP